MRAMLLVIVSAGLIGRGEDCSCPGGPGPQVAVTEVGAPHDPPSEWEGDIPTFSSGEVAVYPIVLVTDLLGNPLEGRRVDWELDWQSEEGYAGKVEAGDVALLQQTTHTNAQGKTATLAVYNGEKVDRIRAKATVFGLDASATIWTQGD